MEDVKFVNDSLSVIKEEKSEPFTASPPRDTTTRKRGFCSRIADISDLTSVNLKIKH